MTCVLDCSSLFGPVEVIERKADIVDHALQKNDHVDGQRASLAEIDEQDAYRGFSMSDRYRGAGMDAARDRFLPPEFQPSIGLKIVRNDGLPTRNASPANPPSLRCGGSRVDFALANRVKTGTRAGDRMKLGSRTAQEDCRRNKSAALDGSFANGLIEVLGRRIAQDGFVRRTKCREHLPDNFSPKHLWLPGMGCTKPRLRSAYRRRLSLC